jgi:hypothetical protein
MIHSRIARSNLKTIWALLPLALMSSLAGNADAAAPPVTISSFAKLDPPSIPPGDFGWSLDASNGKVLVGGFDSYSYIYDVATRHELLRLAGSDSKLNDLFGRSVALSDAYALVGANQGQAAYVFDAHTGQQIRKFSDPNAPLTGGFGFGISVALGGNLALIGDTSDDTKGSDVGAAYLYNITTGQLLHTLFPPAGTPILADFGSGTAISGNSIVVGSPGATGNNFSRGAAFVYDATSGALLRTLFPTDQTPSSNFGQTVKVSGNLALISGNNSFGAGAAYLFDLQTGQELRKFVSPNPSGSGEFGNSIAFDGHFALFGSWDENVNGNTGVGRAYLFDVQTGDLLATLLPDDVKTFDGNFGYSVALSGNTLLAGVVTEHDGVYLTTIPEPTTITLLAISMIAAPVSQRRRTR